MCLEILGPELQGGRIRSAPGHGSEERCGEHIQLLAFKRFPCISTSLNEKKTLQKEK